MIRHGWKVGLWAVAVSLIGAVSYSEAAPPATSEPVAKTESTVEEGAGIEQTGYRRQRRIQRMVDREMQENGGYTGPYQANAGDTSGGYSEDYQSSAPSQFPAQGGPADSSISKASGLNQTSAATPPRKMQRVQPSHAEVYQPGMNGYPAGYCPTGNCQNYGYPAGYCPAGNCQYCDGCPGHCHSGCIGNCFKKLAVCNHGKVQPMNPGFIDDRDTTYYSAQGYGLPVVVPMAPNVRYQMNYGWGLPSSRITRVPYGFPQYYPQQPHTMAGSPQVHGEHPPMVYWPTDTTQLGVYGRRVPHWSPTPNIPQ